MRIGKVAVANVLGTLQIAISFTYGTVNEVPIRLSSSWQRLRTWYFVLRPYCTVATAPAPGRSPPERLIKMTAKLLNHDSYRIEQVVIVCLLRSRLCAPGACEP